MSYCVISHFLKSHDKIGSFLLRIMKPSFGVVSCRVMALTNIKLNKVNEMCINLLSVLLTRYDEYTSGTSKIFISQKI